MSAIHQDIALQLISSFVVGHLSRRFCGITRTNDHVGTGFKERYPSNWTMILGKIITVERHDGTARYSTESVDYQGFEIEPPTDRRETSQGNRSADHPLRTLLDSFLPNCGLGGRYEVVVVFRHSSHPNSI